MDEPALGCLVQDRLSQIESAVYVHLPRRLRVSAGDNGRGYCRQMENVGGCIANDCGVDSRAIGDVKGRHRAELRMLLRHPGGRKKRNIIAADTAHSRG